MAAPRVGMRPLARALSTRFPSRSIHRTIPHNTLRLPFVSAPLASQIRCSSYSSPEAAPNSRKKVTLQTLKNLYKKGEPIAMLTAHDFPSAHVADSAGIDVVLVGDSLGMVAMGLDNTTEIVMEEMIMHCRSVVRGAKSAFIVSILHAEQ